MHFKIILDDSSAGDLTAAYHITLEDLYQTLFIKPPRLAELLRLHLCSKETFAGLNSPRAES